MVEKAKQSELGNGLPRCLNGLLKLQKPLYLDRGPRKRLLKGNYVRHRLDAGLRGASDRDIMLAFYGNAKNRRDLWSHWRERFAPRPGSARKPTGHGSGDTPPSLEYCVLDALDREFLRSESSDDIVLDRLKAEVESRLETWSEADEEERGVTTLLTFTLASLTNERSVLVEAVEQAAELEAEFSDLLAPPTETAASDDDSATGRPSGKAAAEAPMTAPQPAPELGIGQIQSMFDRAFDSFDDFLGSVGDVEAAAIVGGFASELQDRCLTLQADVASKLEEIEDGAATGTLLAAAAGLLDEIGRHAASEAIRDDLNELSLLWRSLTDLEPALARSELDRLQTDVAPAFESLTESHARHRELEEERERLRARKPTSRDERRKLDSRLDNCRERSAAARNRHRSAEDALLRLLAPTTTNRRQTPATEASVETDAASTEEPPAEEAAKTAEDATPVEDTTPVEEAETEPVEPSGARVAVAPELDTKETPPEEAKAADVEKKEPAPKWSEQEQRVRKAVVAALADQPPRLAYAYQICRTAQTAGIEAGLPRAALLEAALFSAHLERAHDELEPDLRDAIQQAVQDWPQEGTLSPEIENMEALIGFAAALAPALLAPYTGAASLLQRLTHEGIPDLYDFCQKAVQRSSAVQNAHVDAGAALRRARRRSKREDALAKLQEDLRFWRRERSKRPLSYTPANRVWEALLGDGGELGQLVQAILTTAQPSRVQAHLTNLEDHNELRQIVDRTSKGLLKARQSIDTKIFRQFQRRMARPLELAHEYLDLDPARSDQTDYRRLVVNEFVSLLRDELPKLREKLDRLATAPEQPPLVRAAAEPAKLAAQRVQDLVEAARDGELTEPPAALLRATGLFRLPAVLVNDEGEAGGEPGDVLEALASAHPTSLESAFESSLGSGNLETAERVLEWAESWAPGNEQIGANESVLWRERLESSKEECLHTLREQSGELRARLELAFRQGQIEPDGRTALDGHLVSVEEDLEQGNVQRFNQCLEKIHRVRKDLQQAVDESLDALQRKAANMFPDGNDPGYRRIKQHIDDGDFVAANELLHRSGEEAKAPVMAEEPKPLLLDAYLAIDREEIRQAAHDWSGIVEAAREGRRRGFLRFDELNDDDRASAAGLLEAWRSLKRSVAGNRQKIAKAAIDLLTRLGFPEVRLQLEAHAAPTTRNFWTGELITSPLSNRDDCPVPHFGSQAGGRYRLLLFLDVLDPPTAPQILQRLRSDAGGRAPIVVCLAPLSDATKEQLARKSFEEALPFVTLDELLLLFLAAHPPSRLASFFALALPFSYCQPFGRRAGSVPPEMFFGREREEQEIKAFDGSCFLYGGRQLGKTALLHRVQETYSAPDKGRFAAVIDLKAAGIGEADTADIWGTIWTALRDLGAIGDDVKRPSLAPRSVEAFMDALHERFNRNTGQRLLLLFDEADGFLRRDMLNSARETFAESSRLKRLMDREARSSIKVVFAGLHNVVQTTTQSNHPLAHLGEPISIGPFIEPEERRQAELLLRLPLQACGYEFDPPHLVRGVLARANYYPSLLQIYGAALVHRLSRPAIPRTAARLPNIGREVVEGTHRSRDLQEQIRRRFEWTLQLDSKYEAIAYATAWICRDDPRVLQDGVAQERILDDVHQWWQAGFKDVGPSRLRALLEELVELGVLRRIRDGNEGGRYTLRNPNVLSLLGDQEEIDRKLTALEGRALEPDLGPYQIRRRHGDKGPLSRPLTLWQERRIAGYADRRNRRNAVVLVCGSPAAGVAHVRDFLTKGQGLVDVKPLASSRSTPGFERDLRSGIKARRHDTTLFLAPAGGATWDVTWIEAAIEAFRKLRSRDRFARAVFTVDAGQLLDHQDAIEEWEKQGVVDTVCLRPWSIDFAARCLDDDPDVGHMLDPNQERRLAALSGGWPVLLDLLLKRLREGVDPIELASENGFATLLEESADLLRASFCLDRGALSEVLRLASECGTAEQHEILGPEAREIAGCTLGEDELHTAFWVASKLSLLREPDVARWQVDPTVARVMQATMG